MNSYIEKLLIWQICQLCYYLVLSYYFFSFFHETYTQTWRRKHIRTKVFHKNVQVLLSLILFHFCTYAFKFFILTLYNLCQFTAVLTESLQKFDLWINLISKSLRNRSLFVTIIRRNF